MLLAFVSVTEAILPSPAEGAKGSLPQKTLLAHVRSSSSGFWQAVQCLRSRGPHPQYVLGAHS